MRILTSLLVGLIIIAFNVEVSAQCCSPGNPVAGTAAAGIVMKHKLRSVTFYRHSFSDTYYSGSKKSEDQGAKANFNFIGQIFTYGITNRLSFETEFGYFLNKTREDTVQGKISTNGLYNATLSAKYCILHTEKGFEITLGAGARMPLTQKMVYNEWNLPITNDMQPSTHAFGFVGQSFLAKSFPELQFKLIWVNRYEINGRSLEKYRFGNAWFSSLFMSKGLGGKWVGLLQFRNENKKPDYSDKTEFVHSGGNVFIISPQISWTFMNWNLTALCDFPLMRKLNGTQISPKYAFGLSINRDFKF